MARLVPISNDTSGHVPAGAKVEDVTLRLSKGEEHSLIFGYASPRQVQDKLKLSMTKPKISDFFTESSIMDPRNTRVFNGDTLL